MPRISPASFAGGVDVHQHVWPDELRRALERRSQPPCLRGRTLLLPTGGAFDLDPDAYLPERRLAELDAAGLAQAVVSVAPTSEPSPDLVEVWHEAAAGLQRSSAGRLIPLGYADAVTGFVGAVIAAPALVRPNGIAPLLQRLEETGGILFVHPGPAQPAEPAWCTSGVAYTAQLQAAYASWLVHGGRWPRLRVVFSLLAGGAPFQLERWVRRGLDPLAAFEPNVWFDTSSYGARAVDLALRTFGAGRLLFGSDAPIDTVEAALEGLEELGPAGAAQIVGDNARALLQVEGERWAA